MKRYLVIVRVQKKAPIKDAATTAAAVLRPLSADGCHLAFSTENADFFGLTLRSERNATTIAGVVAAALPILTPGFIMAFEVTKDWKAFGNSAGWRHLQH